MMSKKLKNKLLELHSGLFCKMVNYFILFFLHVKVNNRIPRALWRRYGHDDVHLRLLHPGGNNNFLCCGQVCFSSISLRKKKQKRNERSSFPTSPRQCMATHHLLWHSAVGCYFWGPKSTAHKANSPGLCIRRRGPSCTRDHLSCPF